MFNLFKGKKGQGAIKYLLIIGAAILIAAIVVTILVSTTKKTEGSVDHVSGDFNSIVSNVDYGVDTNTIKNEPAGCDDACIKQKFKSCVPAKYTELNVGFSIEIKGKKEGYCEVYFIQVKDGIESEYDMTCFMNTDKDIIESLKEASDRNTDDQKPLCEGSYYTKYVKTPYPP